MEYFCCGLISIPYARFYCTKVRLENGWNSKQMITEGEAAIPMETTLHAFRNQEKIKINYNYTKFVFNNSTVLLKGHFYAVCYRSNSDFDPVIGLWFINY